MKNRSELREIIMRVIYQINLLEESKLDYDINSLIKEQIEVENDFVNESINGILKNKKSIFLKDTLYCSISNYLLNVVVLLHNLFFDALLPVFDVLLLAVV